MEVGPTLIDCGRRYWDSGEGGEIFGSVGDQRILTFEKKCKIFSIIKIIQYV